MKWLVLLVSLTACGSQAARPAYVGQRVDAPAQIPNDLTLDSEYGWDNGPKVIGATRGADFVVLVSRDNVVTDELVLDDLVRDGTNYDVVRCDGVNEFALITCPTGDKAGAWRVVEAEASWRLVPVEGSSCVCL